MCGICGIYSYDKKKQVQSSRLSKMMETMKHRGPDDEGTFCSENVGLGFVRLSILDLSMVGHQPMQDHTGRYTIVFNGEIYNYLELREALMKTGTVFTTNTDTEVLLQCYIQFGDACLDRLNGMFAFAVYDNVKKELFAARDRFGVKPFYYFQSGEEFIFASEIPPILEVYGKKNKANEQAIFDYLVFNRTDQTECTFFDGIKKLQHGCCLTIRQKQLKIWRWYDLRSKVENRKEKGDTETYRKLLEDAIRIRLRSDVPVGACLSGGLDSSTIVSLLASSLGKPDIMTFSAIYGTHVKADESKFIDLFRDLLPNMFDTMPNEQTLLQDLDKFVEIHGEPMPSTGPYAQYRVMKLASKYVTVTLDGQGADEALAGYHYFYGLYYKSLLKKFKWITLLKEIFEYIRIHHSTYALKTFAFFLLPSSGRTKIRVKDRRYLAKSFACRHKYSVIADSLYGSKSMRDALINHFEYKLEHLLKWDDRNSMAFSIESRMPFLDYRLVEYTLSLDDNAKIKNGFTKSILREALIGILPEPIRMRRDKKGFDTPEDDWFRTPQFIKLVKEILLSDSFRKREIISSEKAMVLYQKHCNRELNISKDIWKWINLELWFRKYID